MTKQRISFYYFTKEQTFQIEKYKNLVFKNKKKNLFTFPSPFPPLPRPVIFSD